MSRVSLSAEKHGASDVQVLGACMTTKRKVIASSMTTLKFCHVRPQSIMLHSLVLMYSLAITLATSFAEDDVVVLATPRWASAEDHRYRVRLVFIHMSKADLIVCSLTPLISNLFRPALARQLPTAWSSTVLSMIYTRGIPSSRLMKSIAGSCLQTLCWQIIGRTSLVNACLPTCLCSKMKLFHGLKLIIIGGDSVLVQASRCN